MSDATWEEKYLALRGAVLQEALNSGCECVDDFQEICLPDATVSQLRLLRSTAILVGFVCETLAGYPGRKAIHDAHLQKFLEQYNKTYPE